MKKLTWPQNHNLRSLKKKKKERMGKCINIVHMSSLWNIMQSSELTYKLKLKLGYYLEKVFITHKQHITVCMQVILEIL